MKAKTYNLINKEVRDNLVKSIMEIDCDGKIKVTIGNVGTKSHRQQGWDWAIDADIMKSGIGFGDSDLVTVHARNKWLFARPILIRENEVFRSIYNYFMSAYGNDKNKCLIFARDHINTQSMSKGLITEYLNDKFNYWLQKGVNLTSPEDFKLKRE